MYEDPQPRLFSFNNPFGACPTCHGFGNIIELDMDLVVPDKTRTLQQGAIEPWTKAHYRSQMASLKRAAKTVGIPLDVPWNNLTDEEKRIVVEGDGRDYEGIRGFFRWLERKKYKVHVRVFLSRYRGYLTCPECGGARLRKEARVVKVGGRTIDGVSSDTVHEADMIRVGDTIIDLGLGAGEQGGRVVYAGGLNGLLQDQRSLTAKYLRDDLTIPVPPTRRRGSGQKLRLLGSTEHNLKNIDVEIPLNTLTCITGVSGSGKSTLVHDVLYAAVKRAKGGTERRVGAYRKLEGAEFASDVVLVDQSPIGRTPRSNPDTYLKASDPIREIFAATKDAKSRGLTASHFSFN